MEWVTKMARMEGTPGDYLIKVCCREHCIQLKEPNKIDKKAGCFHFDKLCVFHVKIFEQTDRNAILKISHHLHTMLVIRGPQNITLVGKVILKKSDITN